MKKNFAKISDLIFGNALDGNRGITELWKAVINQIAEGVCYEILLNYASQWAVIEFITTAYTVGKTGTVTFLHCLDDEGQWIVAEQTV